jgi:hypothetical protein
VLKGDLKHLCWELGIPVEYKLLQKGKCIVRTVSKISDVSSVPAPKGKMSKKALKRFVYRVMKKMKVPPRYKRKGEIVATMPEVSSAETESEDGSFCTVYSLGDSDYDDDPDEDDTDDDDEFEESDPEDFGPENHSNTDPVDLITAMIK